MIGWLGELIVYGSGATFVWLALVVLIEGDRKAAITWSLALAMLACALLSFSTFVDSAQVLTADSAILVRRVSAVVAALSWYSVAIWHTRASFGRLACHCQFAALAGFSFWAGILMILTIVRPELVGTTARAGTEARALLVATIIAPHSLLWATVAIYELARRRDGTDGAHHRILTLDYFRPASGCAIGTLLLIEMVNFGVAAPGSWAELLIRALAIALLYSWAALVLEAIRTNRKLLGRPIQARDLYARWALLITLLMGFEAASRIITIHQWLAVPIGVVLAIGIVALIEWITQRMYQRVHGRALRLLRDSLTSWPAGDPDVCRDQARRIFKALVKELEVESCYLYLSFGNNSPPEILNHKWTDEPPTRHHHGRFDYIELKIVERHLGFVALRGPRGIAYSQRELALVEQNAYTIASLYSYSQQSTMFEKLVVHREQAQQQRNHELQRTLHDVVGDQLDSILKAARLIEHPGDEWVREIQDAAKESMVLIRSLLRAELMVHVPTVLKTEGLVAAIRSDLFPRYQRQYGTHISLSLDVNGVDEIVLKSWLTHDRQRAVYEAIEELVRNAARHGNRPHLSIQVRLRCDENGLLAEVIDTGVGFIPTLPPMSSGLGLRFQQAAIRLIDGVLDLQSAPESGTHARLHLPQRLLDHPLLAHTKLEWHRIILEVEKHLGGRLLINDDLSDLTRPRSVQVHMLRASGATEAELDERCAIEQQRQAIFQRYLTSYDYRELVDRKRVQRYITTGQTDEGQPGIGLELAHAHIRQVIDLLHHDHYHLALYEQPSFSNFAVKPGYAVLWEPRSPSGHVQIDDFLSGVCDVDPGVVSQFTRRFEEAWQAVPAEMRDKKAVIAWLEAELKAAKPRLQAEYAYQPGRLRI